MNKLSNKNHNFGSKQWLATDKLLFPVIYTREFHTEMKFIEGKKKEFNKLSFIGFVSF